ncbi:DUF2218 domain-containing protein [Streptomyces sp. NBC_01481]|uniref:DUF2218 domain-containing protein n=1 Tax=Streptomyces sp. NBC_01481 TaxID=2975869 RepID=UPI00224D39F3|nr:DUF2218 domain-containing protein [Streptomyces sp. NBC_01481]MCX4584070.1 DUF2218 domain-containing protein [Streptomyces sp. NBC_01481]
MPTAEIHIETERPSRYLVQLCKHFNNKGRHLSHQLRPHQGGDAQALREMQAVAAQAAVEWSDTHGSVSLPWGRCTLQAIPNVLTLRVEAADEENLRRLQDLVAGHLERFGRRDQLKANWQRTDASTPSPGEVIRPTGMPEGGATRHRRHLRTIGLVAAGTLLIAAHLGLGGALLTDWRWTGWAAGVIVAVVLVKVIVLTGLGRLVIRRGKASKSR